MPDITDAIAGLTGRVIAYRILRGMGIMPIEIKGLRAKAMLARSNIDRITKAYDKFNEAAPAHAADVESLAEQISEHQDDLSFAANVLGNSVEPSEKPPAVLPPPPAVIEPEPPASQQPGS